MNVQMNVRIDEQVKRAGDEVFSSLGLSASQVVRSVWEFAAAHREAPEAVRAALGVSQPEDALRLREIEQASSVCVQLRERFDIPASGQLEDLDHRALREQALRERMEERALA